MKITIERIAVPIEVQNRVPALAGAELVNFSADEPPYQSFVIADIPSAYPEYCYTSPRVSEEEGVFLKHLLIDAEEEKQRALTECKLFCAAITMLPHSFYNAPLPEGFCDEARELMAADIEQGNITIEYL